MMPSLRQIGDFFSAVYAPYGEDEVAENRYDYSYSEDYKPYMQQFRNVRVTVRRSALPCSFNTVTIFSSMKCPTCLGTDSAPLEPPNLRPAFCPLSSTDDGIIATFTSKLGKLEIEIVFKFRVSQPLHNCNVPLNCIYVVSNYYGNTERKYIYKINHLF